MGFREENVCVRRQDWRKRGLARLSERANLRSGFQHVGVERSRRVHVAPLPQKRGGMGKALFYGNEFYVMGGETTSSGSGQVAGNVYNRVDVYNPVTNTWRLEAPMPTARHGIFPVVGNDKIFVAGGGISGRLIRARIFWKLIPLHLPLRRPHLSRQLRDSSGNETVISSR